MSALDRIAAPGEQPPEESLVIWVVYRNPSDYPGSYVVRRQWPENGGVVSELVPRAVVSSLDLARVSIPRGLVRMRRHPTDDPVIVESWI